MSREATKTKGKFGNLEKSIFVGKGLDIGCGDDPIFPWVRPFDMEHGDANHIKDYIDEKFDFIFSCHCLEHMEDPYKAIRDWWSLVKYGGYAYIVVPDEDLYEQGVFPSRWNGDHKHTFSVNKRYSWSPTSINIIDLIETLPNAQCVKIEVQDDGYDYGIKDIDQTYQGNGMDAMAQIVFVLKKNKVNLPIFEFLRIRCKWHLPRTRFYIFINRVFKKICEQTHIIIRMLRDSLVKKRYSGIVGKIYLLLNIFGKVVEKFINKFHLHYICDRIQKINYFFLRKFFTCIMKQERKKIFLFQPNGLGDAIINRCYLDVIKNAAGCSNMDIKILTWDSWQGFYPVIYKDYDVSFFDIYKFEVSIFYRLKIYLFLSQYHFETAICNLKWTNQKSMKRIIGYINADNKYISSPHDRHVEVKEIMNKWSNTFDTISQINVEENELIRIYEIYKKIFQISDNMPCYRTQVNVLSDALVYHGTKQQYIVFHLGCDDIRRRWDIENFFDVAARLEKDGYDVVFCGGGKETDLMSKLTSASIAYINKLSAADYTSLISGAAAFLGLDTGPSHLAIACNVPTVVILGGGHYGNYFPYPDNVSPPLSKVAYVVNKKDCFHCDWECTQQEDHRFSCIHDITSSVVYEQLHRILSI